MKIHNHNLNIHYTMPEELWQELLQIYEQMPHWHGFIKGIPHWYGPENGGKTINVSVEPSGLQFYAELPQDEWDSWFELFKEKASKALGYQIGEPEDGFEFRYYD